MLGTGSQGVDTQGPKGSWGLCSEGSRGFVYERSGCSHCRPVLEWKAFLGIGDAHDHVADRCAGYRYC